MTIDPFAYGIQAPIGSVTPLFHKLKDAEDYVAKLTDSRDEAKIIPLYRSPLYALSGNAENVDWTDIAETGRAHADNLVGEPGITKLMHLMAAEIDRLREAIRRYAEQDATLSVQGGNVIVEMDATLTDAEREAVAWAERFAQSQRDSRDNAADYADALSGLLERTKNDQ